jgi:hypothetical protein
VLGKACEFGLEGLSKHCDRAYRAGASPNWLKVKNPAHPAMQRVKGPIDNTRKDTHWGKRKLKRDQ